MTSRQAVSLATQLLYHGAGTQQRAHLRQSNLEVLHMLAVAYMGIRVANVLNAVSCEKIGLHIFDGLR